MADAKGLRLRIVSGPDPLPDLVTDAQRLRQVLLNLLGNAAKFTSHGSVELRLGTAADGSLLRIGVADTGPGIPADQKQRLFQDFDRLDSVASRSVEGAGLGLALSARLATLMGGCLVYEDNPNGGSVFWLELPLEPVASASTAPIVDNIETPQADAVLATLSYHVLVVDDVLMNRDVAGSFLTVAGHTVVCVESGIEAVAAAASTDFDAVLMDVRMPGMDGLEATRRIRALPGTRGQVPIVALTAQAFTEQVATCRAAGMDSHLSKPFDPQTLLVVLLHAITAGHQAVEPVPLPDMPRPDTVKPGDPAVIADAGADLPVFDLLMFKRTATFLEPEMVAQHLHGLAESCERLLTKLRAPDALAGETEAIAESAHTLAGSAGMFGLARLSAIGQQFERAAISDKPTARIVSERLDAAIEASLQAIRDGTLG
jgi:CheY-like chemotaxis protein/HPt (histidine-containing phosphotransfer) domain-containing protein